jgi:hypothetical protein
MEYAYTNWFAVLAEGPDVLILGSTATGGKMNSSGNLSFTKRTLIGWVSGSWTHNDGIALAQGLCDLQGIILAEGLHDLGRRTMPLLQLYLGICITTDEENLSQISRILFDRHKSLRRLGRLFRGSLDWPAEHRLPAGDFSQPLVEFAARIRPWNLNTWSNSSRHGVLAHVTRILLKRTRARSSVNPP